MRELLEGITIRQFVKLLHEYSLLSSCVNQNASSGYMAEFVDINQAIKKSTLTDAERKRLVLWMRGYSSTDIAAMQGGSRAAIYKSVYSAGSKILSCLGVDTN